MHIETSDGASRVVASKQISKQIASAAAIGHNKMTFDAATLPRPQRDSRHGIKACPNTDNP
eukprot:364148-Chlamydomonas_euryale.AAC.3